MNYEIQYLPKEKWKDTRLPILDYTTTEHYEVVVTEGEDFFRADMVKKKFETPVTHSEAEYGYPDGLYEDHWEQQGAEAYGVVSEDGQEILAVIEVCPEEWSNRLLVTNLWVHKSLRRQHIGTALMDLAKAKAKEQGRRVLMLETQSCNVVALAFYRSQGFKLIGFDTCCYTNRDVERGEVRFNMGIILDEKAGDN